MQIYENFDYGTYSSLQNMKIRGIIPYEDAEEIIMANIKKQLDVVFKRYGASLVIRYTQSNCMYQIKTNVALQRDFGLKKSIGAKKNMTY